MQKWEYLTMYRAAGAWSDDRYDGRSPSERLTDLGNGGWELVSVCYDGGGYNFYLKRPVGGKVKAATKKTAAN